MTFRVDKRFALRFLALYFLLNLIVFTVGCAASWVTEASSIIGALIPAIQGIMVILAGAGAGALTPSVIQAVQAWGTQAQTDLENVVVPLIDQYNAAAAAAKPGFLTKIEAALTTITNGLGQILPTLKVDDPALQIKITELVTEVDDEFQAIVNLIPVVKNAGPGAEGILKALAANHALVVKLKSEKQFKKDYNQKAAAFGPKYTNWIK